MTAQTTLAIAGLAFESLGIALVGAADYMPEVRRGATRFVGLFPLAWTWFRAKVLRRPRPVVHYAKAGALIAGGGRITAVTSTSSETLEGKVDYLLRESERTQRRLDTLEGTSKEDRARVSDELAAIRDEYRERVVEAIAEATSEYVTARRLGLVCLGIALMLFTLAAIV